MDNILLPNASLFIGIIPALILLYFSLKGYEGYYKDKTIFLTFIIGIALGFIAAFIQSYTIATAILYIVLLAFFDQLFKTIILNIGRFQEKKETPIYGLSLGLGFGSSFTPFLLISVSSLLTQDINVLSLIAIGSFGIILFHGATGAFIGFGVYMGNITRYLITAVILQIPFGFILGLMISFSNVESIYILIGFVVVLIIYGGLIFWYVIKKVLSKILDQSKRRKRSSIKSFKNKKE